jgi:hypothetical protein
MLLGLLIVMVVATIYYFQWAIYLTDLPESKVNIDQPERYFWWANDSRSYQRAGEWIFGRSDGASISIRPWLYPLLLGLTRTLFGSGAENVMWIVQFLLWLKRSIPLSCPPKRDSIHHPGCDRRRILLFASLAPDSHIPRHDRDAEHLLNFPVCLGADNHVTKTHVLRDPADRARDRNETHLSDFSHCADRNFFPGNQATSQA